MEMMCKIILLGFRAQGGPAILAWSRNGGQIILSCRAFPVTGERGEGGERAYPPGVESERPWDTMRVFVPSAA